MSLLSRLAVQAARAYGILSSNPNNVPASYLVVAGGGGGSFFIGGGGGAGGFRTGTSTLSTLNTYTITVGSGGVAGVAATPYNGTNGGLSSIAGTGLTTITSAGGGFGGAYTATQAGSSGGSGGGGSAVNYAGGAGNTPSTTPSQGNNGGAGDPFGTNSGAGGGGGAGAVGGVGAASQGGAGGAGTASSISGSSVTYAGGGGGGAYAGSGGAGGSGGGGAGAVANATSGTANTGGGGGGNGTGSGGQVAGAGGSGIVIISYASATPKFVGGTLTTSGGNQIHTFTSSGTLSPLTPVTASYLVVAGGGSGGSSDGGGGGAGGLLTSSTTIYSGATYVVTVGAGGAARSAGGIGNSGSNSSLAGTGLTTITSTGGGGGGYTSATGAAGGSGGGSSYGQASGGAGTSGQGNNGGGALTGVPYYGMSGGGGAGAVGGNGTNSAGGAGGAGSASSISGSSVTYAGGGGGAQGGSLNNAALGAGGTGGGGAAGNSNIAATAGTVNTGGGGGGGGFSVISGAGGSGTVIISYAGSQVFNGGLVTSSGGNTIHTFNATGALTPLTNNLNNSLRFRRSASAYLNRTPSVAGNRQKWTWSGWVKRGGLASTYAYQYIFGAYSGSSALETALNFNNDDTITFFNYASGAYNLNSTTTAVFRDPSAWYHIVLAIDTTQSSSANGIRLFINGVQQTLTIPTYTQNTNTYVNNNNVQLISNNANLNSWLDGYYADVNFIDGQSLEPYYFGNNDAYGNWKPILYKGTYGTNGFYLTFADTSALTTSSNVGLGKDTSGNGNYWTTNNISITSGTTYDAMTDVPTNTSATVANYCVINPLAAQSGTGTVAVTTSNANLTWNFQTSGASPVNKLTSATIGVSSGKWYWEITPTTISTGGILIGICADPYSPTNFWSTYGNSTEYMYISNNGNKGNNNVSAAYGSSYTTNDVIGVALDMDAGTLTFYKNNTSQGTAYTGLSGTYFPFLATGSSASTMVAQATFGQRPFSYTPPTGYVALNTYNLPTPTILQGNLYMDATLYTQNGAATNVVVNAGQFKPDLVWIKGRSNATWNNFVDSVRGGSKTVYSNSTSAEGTDNYINTFNSNGFTLNIGDTGTNSTSGRTMVAWQWQAGQGSTSSNTSGTITSTVSVNASAGFSIVRYSGNATSGATVGHGLGVAPKMVIAKTLNTAGYDWPVYHSSLTGPSYVLTLNLTAAEESQPNKFNGVAPSSTVVTLGSHGTNLSGTNNQVLYCFAEIAGFSKFGSYTGNGSTDGPFIYLGFRPKFLLIKMSSAIGDWYLFDSSRDTYNITTLAVSPNSAATETSYTGWGDLLSNGFKIRRTDAAWNTSGGTYIYAAFAENPFKNANAR